VRHLARKLGIDLATVRGTGPAGRILIDDLTANIAPAPAKTAATKPDFGKPGTRIPFQGLRRQIAEHLLRSVQSVPHATYIDEIDVTELVALREQLREPLAERGAKLTYLSFFVLAAARALKEVPIVNASLDESAGEIVLHDRYHVGFAADTPAGLVVPVVRDADRKDLTAVARDIERLTAEARTGRAKRDDLRGGTFSITSIGNIGGLISTPIVNHPEAAILGVGRIIKRPVYDAHGALKPADLLYISLSFDHRILDGAAAAAFGNAFARHVRSPASLLLPAESR
jgi:pyruvate dehydrogenase E2 component (dihydrolipoamide acetyltransferase)/2-oxoisovalerate dehydrogenase E2 component (dihydrolipoyl transacylase)